MQKRILVVPAALAFVAAIYFAMQARGFCYETGAFNKFTALELCDKAIGALIAGSKYSSCAGTDLKTIQCPRAYVDLSEFKVRNPNACQIGYGPEDPSPGILWGAGLWPDAEAGFVVLRYDPRPDAKSAEGTSTRDSELPFRISNCGRAKSAL